MQVAELELVLPVRTQVRQPHREALWVLDKGLGDLHARSVCYALADD